MFIGAPLVARELETGTFRFLWTQGRNRGRWIITKLGILGAALTVLALGFSAVFSWWFGPWASIMGRMVGGPAYEVAGVVFAARTLFAFTLGAQISTSWTLSAWREDPTGHHLSQSQLSAVVQRARLDGVNSDDSFTAWLSRHGYTSWASYQPDSRFWHFQTIEASSYTILALLLAGATIWWVRRRPA